MSENPQVGTQKASFDHPADRGKSSATGGRAQRTKRQKGGPLMRTKGREQTERIYGPVNNTVLFGGVGCPLCFLLRRYTRLLGVY